MQRRKFIRGLAVGLSGMGVLPVLTRAAGQGLAALRNGLVEAQTGEPFWRRVRSEFLLAPGLVHLNSGSLGATPRLIVDAVAGAMRELESDPVHNLWGPMGRAMEAVRERAASFLGAGTDEVALTRNTTEGMNTVASGLALKAGDEILTTNHEHGGGMSCWQHLAERDGVRIVQVKIPLAPAGKAEILERFAAGLSARTRVCSVSHVDTIAGVRMPLADMAGLTRPRGILLVCDGAQAPGMLAVDVKALGVDTYASSSHKWLLAPKGSGLLYVSRAARDRVRPMALRAGFGAYSASSGTRNVPHILGHGLAMDFHETIGRERIAARCLELQRRLRSRLGTVPSLRLVSSPAPELDSGMVTVALTRGRNSEVAARLFREHRIVVKTVPAALVVDPALSSENYNALRFSTHIFNSEADVDRAVEVLAKRVG